MDDPSYGGSLICSRFHWQGDTGDQPKPRLPLRSDMVDRIRGHTGNETAFLTTGDLAPTAEFASDPSGSWGCGAWHSYQWLQIPWDSKAQALDISCKELIPIISASATWGHKWARHQVVCHCDNQVVVAALCSCSSRQPHLMHMLRCVAFAELACTNNQLSWLGRWLAQLSLFVFFRLGELLPESTASISPATSLM